MTFETFQYFLTILMFCFIDILLYKIFKNSAVVQNEIIETRYPKSLLDPCFASFTPDWPIITICDCVYNALHIYENK